MWLLTSVLRTMRISTRVLPSLDALSPPLAPRALPPVQCLTESLRGVHVEVRNGDVERAMKRFKWKLRDENCSRVLRARQYNYSPSELKVLFRKEGEIRRRKKDMKQKLDWILSKRSRGF